MNAKETRLTVSALDGDGLVLPLACGVAANRTTNADDVQMRAGALTREFLDEIMSDDCGTPPRHVASAGHGAPTAQLSPHGLLSSSKRQRSRPRERPVEEVVMKPLEESVELALAKLLPMLEEKLDEMGRALAQQYLPVKEFLKKFGVSKTHFYTKLLPMFRVRGIAVRIPPPDGDWRIDVERCARWLRRASREA